MKFVSCRLESLRYNGWMKSRRKRWAVRGLLFVVYFVVIACSPIVDRLILHPSNDPVELAGNERLPVPWRGGEVEVWTTRTPEAERAGSDGPQAYVLAFIGNADRAEYAAVRTAEQWHGRPVEVWAVNYPGFGGSTGPARLSSIPDSSLAAYAALRRQAGEKPIFLSGLSLGTAAALYVAANRPVAGMVLHNPPPLKQMILGRFGWWNLWLIAGPAALHIPSELDSVANARRATAPAVFLLADADEVVPPAYQRRVADAHAGEKRLVRLPGAHHNDLPEGEAAVEERAGVEWLWAKSFAAATTRPATRPAAATAVP